MNNFANALAGHNGIDQDALYQQLLQDNPKLQTLMQLFSTNQQNTVNEASDDFIDDEFATQLQAQQQKISKQKKEIAFLRRENELLNEQSEILAEALGACHCFGTDSDCPDCGGEGAPGAFIPVKESFEEFVLPVIKSLRQNRTSKKNTAQPEPLPADTQTQDSELQSGE